MTYIYSSTLTPPTLYSSSITLMQNSSIVIGSASSVGIIISVSLALSQACLSIYYNAVH